MIVDFCRLFGGNAKHSVESGFVVGDFVEGGDVVVVDGGDFNFWLDFSKVFD